MLSPVKRRSARVNKSGTDTIEMDEQTDKDEEERKSKRAKVREMSRSEFSKWCKNDLNNNMQKSSLASVEQDLLNEISKSASKDNKSQTAFQMSNELKLPCSQSAMKNQDGFSVPPMEEEKESLDYISPDLTEQCQSSSNVAKANSTLNKPWEEANEAE